MIVCVRRERFVDVVVNGEFYSACKVNAYVSEVGEVSVLINVKAGTRDVHFLCSDLVELTVFELVEMALKRCVIEEVQKQVNGRVWVSFTEIISLALAM